MNKTYTTFQPGDVVRIIPECRADWLSIHSDAIVEEFTVLRVTESYCIHCAGHPQQLRMADGTWASGMWFDSNTPANRKIEPTYCNGSWYDEYGHFQPAATWHKTSDCDEDPVELCQNCEEQFLSSVLRATEDDVDLCPACWKACVEDCDCQ